MRKFNVYFIPEAKEDLQSLDLKLQKKILQKLDWLGSNIEKIKLILLYGKWSVFINLDLVTIE
jgi:mRNA-degrading endonuclease RelE of RelBE toxin-antitoxin system